MASIRPVEPYFVGETRYQLLCLAVSLMAVASARNDRSIFESRTFGFDIHHRSSEQVKSTQVLDALPEKESIIIRERRLAASSVLTFPDVNADLDPANPFYAHYINISLGTPPVSYLVALTTYTSFSWLPCDCSSCLRKKTTTYGKDIDLNIYSPEKSTSRCSFDFPDFYGGISGDIVDDYIHLVTDGGQNSVSAKIAFGCATLLTGSDLTDYYPNGMLGLGRDSYSVPTMLASPGNVSNSFSLCFGADGSGKIFFGDKGRSDQAVTPFNMNQNISEYNISVTQVSVGGKIARVSFTASVDSGSRFTYLMDPQYSSITEMYNKFVKHKPYISNDKFNYCYQMEEGEGKPSLELTMQGGSIFKVISPIVNLQDNNKIFAWCLGIVKSGSENRIGVNFIKGYRLVFDREKDIMGWKADDCGFIPSNKMPMEPNCIARVILMIILLLLLNLLV